MKNGEAKRKQQSEKTGEISPVRALLLATFLVGIGFFVGLGFQSRSFQNASQLPKQATSRPTPVPTQIPLIKGLQSTPDGKKLAWTSVYDDSSRAGIWVFDLASKRAAFTASPLGWQDFVNSWAPDGKSLLVEREKIPRPVAEASAGIYRVPVEEKTGKWRAREEGESLMPFLPRGEKLVSGFQGGDGKIYLKTRREPKRIFRVEGEDATPLDASSQTYGQNRVVSKGGQSSLLVVKNMGESADLALFRVQNGKAQQISDALGEISWSYVSLKGNYFLTARENGEFWQWTLFQIGQRAKKLRSGAVPRDVISVYWSPDEKRVLGVAGKKLWTVEIPSLKYTRLGTRDGWNADDATWIGSQNAVAVAAQGRLWRVEIAGGKEQLLWKFPSQPWG